VPERAARTMRVAFRMNLFGPTMTVWCPGATLLRLVSPLVENVPLGVVLKVTQDPHVDAEHLQCLGWG
jgi:hypothetical protein